MPMMRRGPLDRYTPEWVLRQANAHEAEGSIEFHTDRPVTVYLQGGRAYAAEVGVDLSEADLVQRPPIPEDAARDHLITLLSGVMAAASGWYFHDPLGRHPSHGAWTWETSTLLLDIRTQSHRARDQAVANRTVALRPATGAVTLSPDLWAIVVELATSASADELSTRLGWNPGRTAAALAALQDQGLLVPAPPPSTPVPSAGAWAPEPPEPAAPAPRVAPPGVVRAGRSAAGRSAADAPATERPPPPTVAEAAAQRLADRRGAGSGASARRRRVLPGRRGGP